MFFSDEMLRVYLYVCLCVGMCMNCLCVYLYVSRSVEGGACGVRACVGVCRGALGCIGVRCHALSWVGLGCGVCSVGCSV